jgi:uncharacterized protein YdeI (YjbR/CyaY-like superfamily)
MPTASATPTQQALIPAVDTYIARAAPFAQPVLHHLREIVHEGCPEVVEEIKWSRPFFVYRGVILGNISAFKQHCSFGLWGAEVGAKLRADGAASDDGMGTFGRITSIADLPSRTKLVSYVKTAAKAISSGEREVAWKRPRVAKPDAKVPEALAIALANDKAAAKGFAAMTPSCRREYCQWIEEAKRPETQAKRIVTALEWIAEGKGRNWKYERP